MEAIKVDTAKNPKSIRVDVAPEHQAMIWGTRSNSVLGKQAYNKILKIAENDLDGLKDVQKFINVLVEILENEVTA